MGNKPQQSSKTFSAWQVLHAANSYYELSEVFTNSLPDESSAMAELSVNLSAAMASATNRVLALELYLKALLIGLGQPFPMVHKLTVLFDALPTGFRDQIATHYDAFMKQENIEHCFSVVGAFKLDAPIDEEEVWDDLQPDDLSLAGVLLANDNSFVGSRYLFERASFTTTNSFKYQYRPLGVICKILGATLEQNLPRK